VGAIIYQSPFHFGTDYNSITSHSKIVHLLSVIRRFTNKQGDTIMKFHIAAILLVSTAFVSLALPNSATAFDRASCENGVLEIVGINSSYSSDRYCEKVIISGKSHRISLRNVGSLEIMGGDNVVTVGNVETVSIGGTDQQVALGDVTAMEVMGGANEISTGNIETLTVGGANQAITADNVRTFELAGNDNVVFAATFGEVDVAGGKNRAKADRIRTITIIGSDNLVEYKFLNPNARDPKRPTHPARSISGSSTNVARWTRGE
jgi:hypothetical protein